MYLLDANVFIEAYQQHDAFEVVPAFSGNWIDQACSDSLVASVRKVYDELTGREDDLSEWVGARRRFFLDEDDRVVPGFAAASTWASGNSYRPSAISEFLDSGDYFLIGQDHAHGHTVVTHERQRPTP